MLCTSCGHVWNAAHNDDPSIIYNEHYYSSFTASSQAREYQDLLAKDLDRLVGLGGKTVLEIGCGDGYFLQSMSTLGASAIGFEPSSTFDLAKTQPGVEVFHEQYCFDGTSKVGAKVDVVVMRHVLEHMNSPGYALESLRSNCSGPAPPQYLLTEVPNAYRLLRDNLYFDFYNDHVHYFSYGSLSHFLGKAGWVPMARVETNDEFLGLVAENSSYGPGRTTHLELDGSELDRGPILSEAKRFRQGFENWKLRLTKLVAGLKNQGDRIAVWGAGARGVSLLTGLGLPAHTYDYVVDSDPNKHGKYLPVVNLPICSPDQLRRAPVDCVMVTTYTFFDEVLRELDLFRSSGGKVIRVYPTPEIV